MGAVYRSEGAVASPGHPAETTITVLRSVTGKPSTKHFTPQGLKAYAKENRWNWREAKIVAFPDLARLLAEVEGDRLSLIVQGIVAPAWRDKAIIPRTKRKGDPALIDGGSRVVHFDIDKLPLPLGTGWHDPEAVARAIWQTVIVARVPAFDGVSFFWQASSSAGTGGKAEGIAKLHLWALLDQPIDEDHRKALLKMAGADDSLASINQPNYVARPIFEGVPDPLASVARSGAIIGAKDHAAVDQIAWPEAKIKEAKARKPKGEAGPTITPEGLDHETTEAGRALLDRLCEQIRTAPQGDRNNLINRLAYLIGGHVAGGSIAYAEAREALLKAGLASGHDRYIEAIENGLRDGLQRPLKHKEEAGQDAGDQAIEPYHPPPIGDRDEAIKAHPATVNAWGGRNIPIMQATKAVARAYAEIEHPDADDPDDPEHARKLAEVKKAQRAIRKQIKDQFGLDHLPASKVTDKAPISRVMLTGAQGVGKTQAVVGADGTPGILHGTKGLVSILFEPDHGMAAQARKDYDDNAPEGSPPSIVLRGRSADDPDQPRKKMCRLHGVAGELAKRGASVKKDLCKPCPFKSGCGYLKQEAEVERMAAAPEGVVIFAPHDYAFLPLPGLIEVDLAIFDERPRDHGVEDAEVSFEMLGEPLQFDRPLVMMGATQATSEEADAQAANLQFIRPLMIALRNAGQDHPNRILGALRDQGIDQTRIIGAINGLAYFQERAIAHAMRDALAQWEFSGGSFNLESRLASEIDSREGKIARTLQTIFQALLVEIDKPRDDAVGIMRSDVQRRPGSKERAQGIVAFKTKALRIGRVPFLHLDGTGDPIMAKRLFGEMDVEQHRVERSIPSRGDRIVQVIGQSFSNEALIGGRKGKGGQREPYYGKRKEDSDALRADILKEIKARPGILVIGNKGVIEALKPEEHGAEAAHFNKIRGYNDWKHIDRVMIIGREQPPPAAVERVARAYAAKGDAPFESLGKGRYQKAPRGIRKRDGSGHGIMVDYHPNAWADRVLRQIRDAEIVQAVDRIRPIFKPQPIEIILLSPVAVDLTVDRVIPWKDWRKGGTRIERALKQARVIPLSSREAARLLPGIWEGEKTARDDLRAAGLLRQNLNRDSYLQFDAIRIGVVASYRAEVEAGKRARDHEALIAAPPAEARAVLEALTGPLRDFKVIKVIEANPAAAEAAEAREERIAIAMADGGLSEAEAIRVADGLAIPEPPPVKAVEPEDQSRRAIADIMQRYPTLTSGGFRPPDHPDLKDRSYMLSPKRVREYEIARDYIAMIGTTEGATSRSPSSYETKHVIERWSGQYIGNGMLIVAALSMGVAIHAPIGSPNANLAISRRALAEPGELEKRAPNQRTRA